MAATYLDSNSTRAEAVAAYKDNAAYDLEDDTDKAKMFVNACRFLIAILADEVKHGDESVREVYQKYQDECTRALAWWRANDSTATTARAQGTNRYLSLEEFRT